MDSSQSDRRESADRVSATRMVDVGGRRLALTCTGTGSPTVVLETGLGAESNEWRSVQTAVERYARVLSYDRAGRGQSDKAARPRSAAAMVEDLHALLRAVELPGPYVLVGHSFGGLLVRIFAHRYPREVQGLVLVDAMHEDQFEVFGPKFPPANPSDPPELRSVRAFWTTGWRSPESTTEGIDFVSSLAQARAARSLGHLPIHILTAGTFRNQPLVPAEHRDHLQRCWEDLQGDFLRFSSAARQSFVRDSDHFIQRHRPELVADAIASVIAIANKGAHARHHGAGELFGAAHSGQTAGM